MSEYDFSNSEVDDWIAEVDEAAQKGERDNLLLLLQRRRDRWLAVEPSAPMTIARADECKQIIGEIENDPIRPEGYEPEPDTSSCDRHNEQHAVVTGSVACPKGL